MADDITIENPAPPAGEGAAVEALAEVAHTAIEETAQRTEQVTLAVAELAGARAELSALRSEFIAHVEGNRSDFETMASRIQALEMGVGVMQQALAEAMEDEEELEDEVEEAVEDATIAEAASVEAALADEPKPVEETAPVHIDAIRAKRHFIRI
jgi:chromosome segregation ATPase